MDEKLFFNHWRDNKVADDLAPTFDNQRKFLEILLQGKDFYLVPYGINVLTMRLLLAQEAFRGHSDLE